MLAPVLAQNGRLPETLRAGIVAPTKEELEGWAALPPGAGELASAGGRPLDDHAATPEPRFSRAELLLVLAAALLAVVSARPAAASYNDGSRLRLVAYRTKKAVYWVSNTLLQTLTNQQMLALAQSLTRVGH